MQPPHDVPVPPGEDRPVPPGYAAGAPVPWWVKLGVKLVMGSLPVPARAWRAIGLRRHSFDADNPAVTVAPLRDWASRFRDVAGRAPRGMLELGPGAMVRRAPVAAALGFGPIWYLDVEDDAPRDLGPYLAAAEAARAAGLAPPDLSSCRTHQDVLAACGARLLIGGTERLEEIGDGAADLVVSVAVLEHVRRDAMAPLFRALRRVAAPDGLSIHAIDLHDHLGGGLRHLAFSPAFWEGPAVARAALYCNRLGLSEMVAMMHEAGFATAVRSRLLWPAAPLPPGGAHPSLRRAPQDDLTCAAVVECRPG
ncbi:methyltransferase domain-containing protein [Falsiroseomonas sp. HW251]|uniref:methyltransferase domain-containing protein n=1 Tax=Falsiroseomonas sp. HW251 TaxID=3390998 RepID=UPI003D3226F5